MNKTLINSLFRNDKTITKDILLITMGVLFLAVVSQIKIYLGFTPVPITGQTFAVFLIALTYTRRQSFLVLLTYVVLGSFLPVFANGGTGQIFKMATGGYIIGFFFAAQILGYIAEKGLSKSYIIVFISLILANILIYAFGIAQLSAFMPNKSFLELLNLGMTPFIFGDATKIVLAMLLLPNMWKLVK